MLFNVGGGRETDSVQETQPFKSIIGDGRGGTKNI